MFASQDLDVPRLLHAAGLDPRLLERPQERVAGDKVSELWELAVAWSGNPNLGLDADRVARFVNFDLVAYPMLTSPDLLTGLQSLARYMAVLSDATTLELQMAPGGCWLVIDHIGATRPVPRQRQEHALLAVLILCRWITRRPIQPLAAEFHHPAPIDAAAHRQAFGCPVRFDQACTRMFIASADMHAPLPSHNPLLQPVLARAMDERLALLGHGGLRRQVSDEILRRLHLGEPRREDVAHTLALTERTLQRRLHDEHTSFQQLLDATRRELAASHLADPRYTLGQIADLLGFADQSNFFRACRRWFGVSPGRYREQLAQAAQLVS